MLGRRRLGGMNPDLRKAHITVGPNTFHIVSMFRAPVACTRFSAPDRSVAVAGTRVAGPAEVSTKYAVTA
jgi:hypothetical protein